MRYVGFHAVTQFQSDLEAKYGAEGFVGFGAVSVGVSGTDALGYVCVTSFSL